MLTKEKLKRLTQLAFHSEAMAMFMGGKRVFSLQQWPKVIENMMTEDQAEKLLAVLEQEAEEKQSIGVKFLKKKRLNESRHKLKVEQIIFKHQND